MPSSPKNPAFSYAVYLESSTDPRVKTAADSSIAKLPKYVTHLVLSHMQPDSQYNGGVTFEKTGLYFRSDPAVVKDAIALLKEKNPNTKVLLSVGGFDYDNWEDFNAAAVVEFVHTFGLDGVDIDYEPSTADCSLNQGRMQCDTDEEYIGVIRSLRAALPRPNILTNAVMHVGAYGEGKWAGLEPVSQYTGLSINPLRKAGDDLDTIMLMSYDAGELYQPMLALDACAEYFRRDILLGVEAGPESWGARVLSNTTIDSLTHDVSQRNTAGMMLWHAYKPVDPGTPTSNQISERICSNLNLEDCSSPLVPE